MAEQGTPVSTCDEDAHAAIARHRTASIARAIMRAPEHADDAAYLGGVPAAGWLGAAGATSPLVILLVNRQPSLVLVSVSV